jgi:hypothetical protein
MKALFAPASPSFLAASLGVLVLASCASAPPHDETALIQAGFHPVLPETVTERNAYAALPPYTIQRTTAPERPVYAYRDESQNITYICEEADYKRYQKLTQKKGGVDHPEMLTAQANVDAPRSIH